MFRTFPNEFNPLYRTFPNEFFGIFSTLDPFCQQDHQQAEAFFRISRFGAYESVILLYTLFHEPYFIEFPCFMFFIIFLIKVKSAFISIGVSLPLAGQPRITSKHDTVNDAGLPSSRLRIRRSGIFCRLPSR